MNSKWNLKRLSGNHQGDIYIEAIGDLLYLWMNELINYKVPLFLVI